ncbi:MAG: hypothetical protein FJ146_07125 [Deltaproteobacteria bacterium]|nr:hypothetical protein [Deltaproteobacteria bacterium]
MITKIRFKIKNILFRQDLDDLSNEQIVYLNQHRERELARGVGYYNKLGLFGYVLGTAAVYFVGHPKLKLIAMLWTSTLALECLIWIFAERFVKPHKRELMVTLRGSFIIISCLVCCASFFDSVFKDPQFTPDYYVMAGLILEIIGWGIGAATLLYGHLVVMFLCVLPLITLLPSVSERSSNQVGLFILALLPNVCIGGYFFVETKIRRRLALVEFNAQQLSMQNELLKRQTIERELEIARAVQDAFQSPVGTKKIRKS